MEQCKYSNRVLIEKDVVLSQDSISKEIFSSGILPKGELYFADKYVKEIYESRIQDYLKNFKRKTREFPLCAIHNKFVDIILDSENHYYYENLNAYYICKSCCKILGTTQEFESYKLHACKIIKDEPQTAIWQITNFNNYPFFYNNFTVVIGPSPDVYWHVFK